MAYLFGLGTEPDRELARKWLKNAGESGEIWAKEAKELLEAMGPAASGLPAGAEKKLKESTDQGAEQAGSKPDLRKAFLLARKSPDAQVRTENRNIIEREAEKGNAVAQCMLGNIFFTERNNELAFKWYSKAADQGDAGGQWLVGLSYLYGDGVPKDLAKAREWLEKAAAQKHPEAQAQLEKLKTP